LQTRGLGAEPKAQKCLEKGNGGLVLVQALQLSSGGVYHANIFRINAVICKYKKSEV
jgi:hypothetical protein